MKSLVTQAHHDVSCTNENYGLVHLATRNCFRHTQLCIPMKSNSN